MEKTRKWRKILAMMLTVVMMLQNAQSVMVFADVTNEQIEQMNLFLKENHYELDETLPILQLKLCEESQEQKAVRTENYLNQLQQQEISKNQQVAATTPMMGMEL